MREAFLNGIGWSLVSIGKEGSVASVCTHLDQIRDVSPRTQGCEECLQMGDTWFHLRMCLTCGHVGCCDSSKNKHASAHWHENDHPVVASAQPGEAWRWCFVDDMYV